MGKTRLLFFLILMITGIACVIMFYFYKPKTRLESSFAPAYQLFGHATKGVSRALSVVMRIDDLDEKKYGDAIASECDQYIDRKDRDYIYVNKVMETITKFKKKPFEYRVYMNESGAPNAFALPGGVIFVTRGLLATIHSQSELAAVLAHEMGHVELSHCLDAVQFELAAKKIGAKPLGELADMAMTLLMKHSFSKTQEDEADTYAFELLTVSSYDPSAEGRVYEAFIKWCEKHGEETDRNADVIRDYFLSHPPLEIRAEKFSESANIWWKKNPREKRYVGVKNLKNRKAAFLDREWNTGKK